MAKPVFVKAAAKEKPKLSQLTQSEFWPRIYSLQEGSGTVPEFEDLKNRIDEIKSELEDLQQECQDKLDNMPEGLQQGDTGQMIQERIDELENAISTIDSVNTDFDESTVETEDQENKEEAIKEAQNQFTQDAWDEVTSALDMGCS